MRYEDSGLTETIAADSDEDNSFKAQCEVGWYASREREESSVRSEATSVRSKATSDVDGAIPAGTLSGSSGVAHSGVGSGAMAGKGFDPSGVGVQSFGLSYRLETMAEALNEEDSVDNLFPTQSSVKLVDSFREQAGRLVYGRGNNHTDVTAPFLPAVMTKVSHICQCLWKSSCV